MISEELLAAKGTGIGLVGLSDGDVSHYQVEEVAETMELSESTAEDRVESLVDNGVLEKGAQIIDDEPTSVFSLTEDGEHVAETLERLLENVDRELLFSRGTTSVVMRVTEMSDSVVTAELIAEELGTSKSTARRRLDRLVEDNLVEQSAQLVDDTPTRVFNLTDYGRELADELQRILD